MELWYYIACYHSFTHQSSECWNVCISRRPVQELWLYRSDILCCFWHPVTFSSVSSWFKLALERVGPGAGGKARPSSPAPAPRWLRSAAEPGLGGSGQPQPPLKAQLTHKPQAGSVSQAITCIPFSLLYCDARNFFPLSHLKFRAHSKVELIISWL